MTLIMTLKTRTSLTKGPAMADNLLPCPFCCGAAEADYQQSYRDMSNGQLDHGAAIYCLSCNANMIICRGDTPELSDEDRMAIMVENWNRRDFSPMTIAGAVVAAVASAGWQPMETAPLDGKHCIIAVQEGAFIYSVQGSFDGKRWNAVHAVGVKPLCWMPNVRLPPEFLPAKFLQSPNAAKGASDDQS